MNINMISAFFQVLLLSINEVLQFSEYMIFPILNSSLSSFNRKGKMPGSTGAGNQHYRIPSQKAFKFYVVSQVYDKSMCNVM